MLEHLQHYVSGKASSLWQYFLQELIVSLCGGIPSLPGVAIRAIAYKLIMKIEGLPGIEANVRIAYAENIKLGRYVYIDSGVYLHATPGGIDIGERTFIMHNSELHVFNFRDLPHAFIKVGARTFIGESTIIRGQGGVTLGESVLIGPGVQIMAINHNYADPTVHIMDQGISGEGIVIEDGVWIGAGAVILDGVHIGKGAVIGANAVVSRDIPAHALAVGSPAKVVRQLDSDDPQVVAAREAARQDGANGKAGPMVALQQRAAV
jgi:acetyltransferase-like isoleucine patch superfamily enzyme